MLMRAVRQPQAGYCDNTRLPGTFLPFLYQTHTIQQRTYTKISRGTKTSGSHDPVSRRRPQQDPAVPYRQGVKWQRPLLDGSKGGKVVTRLVKLDRFAPPQRERRDVRSSTDGVPFENAAQNAVAGFDQDKSTITPRERKAFEKLFGAQKVKEVKKAAEDDDDEKSKAKERGSKGKVRKPAQELGLDDILDNAMDSIKSQERRTKPRFPDVLRPMAEEARDKQKARLADTRENLRTEAVKRDLDTVNGLLDEAKTDLDLWKTLQEYVLNRVAALDLDQPGTRRQQIGAKAWEALKSRLRKETEEANVRKTNPAKRTTPFFDASISDLNTLTANLPAHLLHFMHLMRTSYPSSLLPLNLLPTLKALGPSAFALGASTQLYNAHLSLLHAKFPTHLPNLLDVLAEMDREVYAFDDETLGIVQGVLKSVSRAQYGHEGPGVRALFQSEKVRKGVVGLERWRGIIEERRQEDALRKARQAEEEVEAREVEGEEGDEEAEVAEDGKVAGVGG